MAVVHDLTPQGRLMALLERCQMHADRGDFRYLPGLMELTYQCSRVVRAHTQAQMDAKVIDFKPPAQHHPDELPI